MNLLSVSSSNLVSYLHAPYATNIYIDHLSVLAFCTCMYLMPFILIYFPFSHHARIESLFNILFFSQIQIFAFWINPLTSNCLVLQQIVLVVKCIITVQINIQQCSTGKTISSKWQCSKLCLKTFNLNHFQFTM